MISPFLVKSLRIPGPRLVARLTVETPPSPPGARSPLRIYNQVTRPRKSIWYLPQCSPATSSSHTIHKRLFYQSLPPQGSSTLLPHTFLPITRPRMHRIITYSDSPLTPSTLPPRAPQFMCSSRTAPFVTDCILFQLKHSHIYATLEPQSLFVHPTHSLLLHNEACSIFACLPSPLYQHSRASISFQILFLSLSSFTL